MGWQSEEIFIGLLEFMLGKCSLHCAAYTSVVLSSIPYLGVQNSKNFLKVIAYLMFQPVCNDNMAFFIVYTFPQPDIFMTL